MGSWTAPLTFNYTHVDTPVEAQTKAATLGDILQQRQLRSAQMADIQAQATERNRQLAGIKQVTDLMRVPANQQAAATGDFGFLTNAGVDADIASKAQSDILGHAKSLQDLDINKTKLYADHRAIVQQGLDSLGQVDPNTGQYNPYEKDPNKFAAQWHQMKAGLHGQINPQLEAQIPDIDPNNPNASVASQAGDFAATNSYASGLMANELNRQKTLQENKDKAADAANKAATLPKINAEAQIEQQKADLYKQAVQDFQNNSGGTHPIDKVLPPELDKTANASFKADFNTAMMYGGPDAAARVVAAAGAHAAALSPEKRAADVKEATDKERAASGIILNREVALQRILNAQQGPELAGVALKDQPLVKAKYEKNLTDFNNSLADANRLHSLIQSAQGGNKAAPAVIPLAELRGFVNRVNSTELRSVGTAGSLIDKVQGWLEGKTEGQPIPPDILQATDQLTSLQAKNAQSKHNAQTTIDNKVYHANYKPATPEDLGYGPIAGSANTLPAKLSVSDIGKTFYSAKQGKNIKVTAVNPANPTQFKWEDAK